MQLSIPKTPLTIQISSSHAAAFSVVTIGCMLVDPFGHMNPLSGFGLLAWWFFINATSYLSGELVTQNTFRLRDPDCWPFGTIVVASAVAALLVGGNVSLVILIMTYVVDCPYFFWPTFSAVSKLAFLIAVGRLFFFLHERIAELAIASAPEVSEQTAVEAESGCALALRLPAYLGENILYLRSQDHYVEVMTDKGSHLIKMRFRDAMEEVKPLQGQQIHRSCWVRQSAVVRAKTHNRRLLIETSDGARHPVSRSFIPDVRAKMRL